MHEDVSPAPLINIRPCFADPMEPLPFFSLEGEKPLTQPQIDALAFPALVFAPNSQTLHHTHSHAVSKEKSWFQVMFLILHGSVWADRHSIPDIRLCADGFVSVCLLAGRGVGYLMYWAYVTAVTEPIAALALYRQDFLPCEYNGSKHLQYNTIYYI